MKHFLVAIALSLSIAPAFAAKTSPAPTLPSDFPAAWQLSIENKCVRPDGIVLNMNVYDKAGKEGLYRIYRFTKNNETVFLVKGKFSNATQTRTIDAFVKKLDGTWTVYDAETEAKEVTTATAEIIGMSSADFIGCVEAQRD